MSLDVEAAMIEVSRDGPIDACLPAPRLAYDGGITVTRHRALWERLIGPLHGMRLVRRLDAPCTPGVWCANPFHFEQIRGTRRARGRGARPRTGRPDAAAINRAKTQCPHGHDLTPGNVYIWTDSRGRRHRKCRACTIRRAQRARSQQ